MTNLVVIDVKGAPKYLTGHLQRIMLEVRPGTFVWKLSVKKTRQVWDEIKSLKCSAICISSAKTESGFVVASHGENSRVAVNNFGVSLIMYKSLNTKAKNGKSQDGNFSV